MPENTVPTNQRNISLQYSSNITLSKTVNSYQQNRVVRKYKPATLTSATNCVSIQLDLCLLITSIQPPRGVYLLHLTCPQPVNSPVADYPQANACATISCLTCKILYAVSRAAPRFLPFSGSYSSRLTRKKPRFTPWLFAFKLY